MGPVPQTDQGAGVGPDERRQRLSSGALLIAVVLAAGAGVTSLRDWQLHPDSTRQLHSDFDEFHLEDRFHRVSEDAGAAEAGPQGGEVRLVRTFRTAAGPQDAIAQVRTALRAAGVSSTIRTEADGPRLTSTADLQERGRRVTASVVVDERVPAQPTMIRIVLTDWA